MQLTFITAVALFAASAVSKELFLNEPKLVQCGKVKSSWSPGVPPYNVIAVASSDTCGKPLQVITDTTETFVEWTVAIAAGTTIQITVADSTDENEGWTRDLIVGESDDKSCLSSAANLAPTSSGANTASTPGATTVASDTGSSGDPGSDAEGNGDLAPVGAANAGSNQLLGSGASARQGSVSVLALGAIAAVAAFAL